jgi:hypothetical protein
LEFEEEAEDRGKTYGMLKLGGDNEFKDLQFTKINYEK